MKKDVAGIDINDIGNLEDFSMKNVGSLKQTLMVESLREILTKRRRHTFYKAIDLHALKNAAGEGISSTSKQNTMNQLGKHKFS